MLVGRDEVKKVYHVLYTQVMDQDKIKPTLDISKSERSKYMTML